MYFPFSGLHVYLIQVACLIEWPLRQVLLYSPSRFTCTGLFLTFEFYSRSGGRVMKLCWVNFQCRGVLLICRCGRGLVGHFSLIYHLSLSLSLSVSGRRPDIECKTVSKGREIQNNQPTILLSISVLNSANASKLENSVFSIILSRHTTVKKKLIA